MLNSLTGVSLSTEKDATLSEGGLESKLIKSQHLTSSLDDTGTSSGSDAEGADGHLGDIQETDIIGNGANHDSHLGLLALHEASQSGNGHGRLVDAGHEETLEDNLVEV